MRRLTLAAVGMLLALPARGDPPTSILVTQTVYTLTAATDKAFDTSTMNGARMLCVQNIGTGLVNLAFGTAAVAATGWALNAAAGAGQGGGQLCWSGETVPRDIVHGISTAGSTVVVLVGR